MVYVHHSKADVNETFTCVLTHQYIEVFIRKVPYSFTITLCVMNTLLAIIATLLNLLIIAAIVSTPRLQTPSFILLGNLALTDFAVGITFGPIEVAYLITRSVGQYGYFCIIWKVLSISGYFLCSASMYTVTSISFDRYLSMSMPVKYRTVVTKKKACRGVIMIWVCSALGTSTIGVLGNEAFLILVCCVTFFNLVVIIDCYLLSFAVIKQRKEIRPSTTTLTRKSKSEPDLCARTTENRLSAIENRLSDYENRMSGILGQKVKEDLRKREQKPSSSKRRIQLAVLGEELKSTIDTTKPKFLLVNMDMESVIENIEIEEKHVRNVESEDTLHDEITGRNEVEQEADDTTKQNRLQSLHCDKDESTKLTIQKSELLADVKQFEKSLHTILIIVVALFLCYLPYMVVSILISLHVIDSGVSKNSAAIMIYMNSSINSFIMCTRISGISKACGRIIRKIFCMK